MIGDGELHAWLACAEEAVRRAGSHALANLHRRAETISRTAHDVKLALDFECQAIIERTIRERFPSHAILGEEGRSSGSDADIVWIVDPLDGTVNFSHGVPYWCHSVAVRAGEKTVAGAIYSPPLGELYTALEGGPAACNGRPIRVSSTARLAEALILTGIEKNFDQYSDSLEVARTVATRAQKMRLFGAAALDLCQVACGRADGFYESGLNVWDVAAADLVCRCAGAKTRVVARLSDTKIRYVAGSPAVFEELLALLAGFPAWMKGIA